ncbi:lipoate--protein ligase family protein [Actinomycetaceae bacterium TAE3-ERU4]|nr:lipoate--protein ligase family protein [Actinomycetaceae bacterium TAE3-ERU4]
MRGEYKQPGCKLIVVDVEVNDGHLENVSIAGDFFLDPDTALDRYNHALCGLSVDSSVADIVDALEKAKEPNDNLFGFTFEGIAIAVRRALKKASSWEELHFEVINGPVVDPMINIALDEVLAEEMAAGRRGPTLRIWHWNAPLIVMGSFQSYDNEINPAGVKKHGITVSRRVTGGGTMFMEPGNCITYSLIVPTSLVDGMNFAASYEFLDQWVMGALEKVGVKAKYVPLNDIASEQGKIAGAAQKRYACGITLHHVTMAYDIDTLKMLECMRIGAEKIRDKGVRSAVKRVDPMRSQTGMERTEIIEVFLKHFARLYDTSPSEITEAEMSRAQELVKTKFLTPEWIHKVP